MQEFCCFIVFLCQYIHSFVFPEMALRGAIAPLATPLNPPLTVARKPTLLTVLTGNISFAMHWLTDLLRAFHLLECVDIGSN